MGALTQAVEEDIFGLNPLLGKNHKADVEGSGESKGVEDLAESSRKVRCPIALDPRDDNEAFMVEKKKFISTMKTLKTERKTFELKWLGAEGSSWISFVERRGRRWSECMIDGNGAIWLGDRILNWVSKEESFEPPVECKKMAAAVCFLSLKKNSGGKFANLQFIPSSNKYRGITLCLPEDGWKVLGEGMKDFVKRNENRASGSTIRPEAQRFSQNSRSYAEVVAVQENTTKALKFEISMEVSNGEWDALSARIRMVASLLEVSGGKNIVDLKDGGFHCKAWLEGDFAGVAAMRNSEQSVEETAQSRESVAAAEPYQISNLRQEETTRVDGITGALGKQVERDADHVNSEDENVGSFDDIPELGEYRPDPRYLKPGSVLEICSDREAGLSVSEAGARVETCLFNPVSSCNNNGDYDDGSRSCDGQNSYRRSSERSIALLGENREAKGAMERGRINGEVPRLGRKDLETEENSEISEMGTLRVAAGLVNENEEENIGILLQKMIEETKKTHPREKGETERDYRVYVRRRLRAFLGGVEGCEPEQEGSAVEGASSVARENDQAGGSLNLPVEEMDTLMIIPPPLEQFSPETQFLLEQVGALDDLEELEYMDSEDEHDSVIEYVREDVDSFLNPSASFIGEEAKDSMEEAERILDLGITLGLKVKNGEDRQRTLMLLKGINDSSKLQRHNKG